MEVGHSGARIPHHLFYLLPHAGLIAMHGALGACCFSFLERAFFEA